jgi:hypothetical protein
VIEAVRARRPVVGAALEHATPAALRGDELVLAVTDSAIHLEGLERNRAEVEAGLAAVFGARLRVSYGSAPGAPARPSQGRRLDQQADRDQRLKAYRAKDQALDAIAEGLDLELLE